MAGKFFKVLKTDMPEELLLPYFFNQDSLGRLSVQDRDHDRKMIVYRTKTTLLSAGEIVTVRFIDDEEDGLLRILVHSETISRMMIDMGENKRNVISVENFVRKLYKEFEKSKK